MKATIKQMVAFLFAFCVEIISFNLPIKTFNTILVRGTVFVANFLK